MPRDAPPVLEPISLLRQEMGFEYTSLIFSLDAGSHASRTVMLAAGVSLIANIDTDAAYCQLFPAGGRSRHMLCDNLRNNYPRPFLDFASL